MKRAVAILACAPLWLSGVSCGEAETEPPLPEPPESFEVGVTTLNFVDDGREDRNHNPRALKVEVWYPAVPSARLEQRDDYDMVVEAPEDLTERICGIDLPLMVQDAARDVPVEETFGPYPLLIFSHGKNGIRFQTHSLMTYLASRGYVVAAPDHTDDLLWELIRDGDLDPAGVVLALVDRPQDVSFVADQLFYGSDFGPLLDDSQFGMFGHSFGGAISIMVTSSTCEFFDERVSAILPLAPAAHILPTLNCGIDNGTVPALILGGKLDDTTGYEFEQVFAYDTSPEPKGLIGIHDAGHFSFTELCELDLENLAAQLGLDAGDVLTDGCGPEFIAQEDQHRLQNYFGENFFDAFVRQDDAARSRLAPWVVPEEILPFADYVQVGLVP